MIHSIAKDLAVWEKADIDYNGRRHTDDDGASDLEETALEDEDFDAEESDGLRESAFSN